MDSLINGLSARVDYYTELRRSSTRYRADFFVKKWNFDYGERRAYFSEDDPRKLDSLELRNGNKIFWAEQDGAVAQGNTNPRSEFCNHAIVKYNSDYYDPSYGTGNFASISDWQNSSLAGFGGKCLLTIFGGVTIKEYELIWYAYPASSIIEVNVNP